MYFVRNAGFNEIGLCPTPLPFQEEFRCDFKICLSESQIVSLLDGGEIIDIDCHFNCAAQSLAKVPLIFVGTLVVLKQVLKLLVKLA